MTTYLYGLILARNAPRVPANARGIDDTPVRVLSCEGGGLAALVGTLDRVIVDPTLDMVRAHDGALQVAVDARVTVAAVRFKQSFASDAETCRHVNDHGARIARMLEDSDGCVEMRVLVPDGREVPAVPPTEKPSAKGAGPGLAYLQQLRGMSPTLRRLSLRTALGSDSGIRAERITPIRDDAAAFAHLVHRDDVGRYREAIRALPALAGATVVGPLALYTFAEPGDE